MDAFIDLNGLYKVNQNEINDLNRTLTTMR